MLKIKNNNHLERQGKIILVRVMIIIGVILSIFLIGNVDAVQFNSNNFTNNLTKENLTFGNLENVVTDSFENSLSGWTIVNTGNSLSSFSTTQKLDGSYSFKTTTVTTGADQPRYESNNIQIQKTMQYDGILYIKDYVVNTLHGSGDPMNNINITINGIFNVTYQDLEETWYTYALNIRQGDIVRIKYSQITYWGYGLDTYWDMFELNNTNDKIRYLSIPSSVTALTNGFLNLSGYESSWCYQEQTNQSSGSDGNCGLNYSGTYSVSGKWNDGNFATNSSPPIGTYYINYTKPQNASKNSYWKIKDQAEGGAGYSSYIYIGFSNACWDYNINMIALRARHGIGPGGAEVWEKFECQNSTDWEVVAELYMLTPPFSNGGTFYEEAMNWSLNVPTNVTIKIDYSSIFYNLGQFTQTNNRTSNLASTINRFLNATYLIGSNYIIPFVFHSDTAGILQYLGMLFNNQGFLENSITYTTPVFELSSQAISMNFSFYSSEYIGLSGTLIYNNTRYGGTISGSGNNRIITKTITTPSVASQQNISFYWEMALQNTSTTSYFNSTLKNQTVNNLGIDDCSVNSVLIFNYTLKDEDDQTMITPSASMNTSVELDLDISSTTSTTETINLSMSKNNTNPVRVCISANLSSSVYRIDSQVKYSTTTRETEYYTIKNFSLTNTSIPQNINLLDLLTANSQEFTVIFKDSTFRPLAGAVIDVTRKYLTEGMFKTVERPETDSDGRAVIHLIRSNGVYKLNVLKDGSIIYISDSIVPVCQNPSFNTCEINLNQFGTAPGTYDYATANNIAYSPTFDSTNRLLTMDFSTLDGSSANVQLNVTKFDNYGNNTICSPTLSSSSGTLSCSIPTSIGNVSIFYRFYKDGSLISTSTYTLKVTPTQVYGAGRIILVIMLFITLVGLGLGSKEGTIISAFIGLVLATILNIYSTGFVGAGATILWFLIAGGIILYKSRN